MRDFEAQIKAYTLPETEGATIEYFDRYWLDRSEYESEWALRQESIYSRRPSDEFSVSFRDGFNIVPLVGGLVFIEEDFALLQDCMTQVGDRYFVIVEDYDEDDPPHDSGPPLRFRYPAGITWEDIMGGGYVSTELFRMPHKNYFVFGDTATWGKYVANDWLMPLDIIGFQEDHGELFLSAFERSFREREHEVMEALPHHLRSRIIST